MHELVDLAARSSTRRCATPRAPGEGGQTCGSAALRQVVPDSLAFYFEIVARETLCEGAAFEHELVAPACAARAAASNGTRRPRLSRRTSRPARLRRCRLPVSRLRDAGRGRCGRRARGGVDRGRGGRAPEEERMHRTKMRVAEDALDANETIARANRDDFDRAGVSVVNLMSAPGAGKTTLLERALDGLATSASASSRATCREASTPTGSRPPPAGDPAQHRLGLRRRMPPGREHGPFGAPGPAAGRDRPAGGRERRQPRLPGRVQGRRGREAMVSSVAEGEDKPLKYPLMFRTASWSSSTRLTCSRISTSTWSASATTSTRSTRGRRCSR